MNHVCKFIYQEGWREWTLWEDARPGRMYKSGPIRSEPQRLSHKIVPANHQGFLNVDPFRKSEREKVSWLHFHLSRWSISGAPLSVTGSITGNLGMKNTHDIAGNRHSEVPKGICCRVRGSQVTRVVPGGVVSQVMNESPQREVVAVDLNFFFLWYGDTVRLYTMAHPGWWVRDRGVWDLGKISKRCLNKVPPSVGVPERFGHKCPPKSWFTYSAPKLEERILYFRERRSYSLTLSEGLLL